MRISISIFLPELVLVVMGEETNFFHAARVGGRDILVALYAG